MFGIKIYDHPHQLIAPILSAEKSETEIKTKGVFYHIIGKDGEVKGYLLGTLHFGNKEVFQLNHDIHIALKKATSIFLEYTPEEMAATLPLYVPKTPSNEEVTALNNFQESLFSQILNFLDQREGVDGKDSETRLILDEFQVEARRSMASEIFKMIMLSNANAVFVKNPDPDGPPIAISLEILLNEFARAKGLAVDSLESNLVEALELISKTPLDILEGTINVEDYFNSQLQGTEELWKNWVEGNTQALYEENQKNYKYQNLLSERNIKIASKMNIILNEGGLPFFAIGVIHTLEEDPNSVYHQLTTKYNWTLQSI